MMKKNVAAIRRAGRTVGLICASICIIYVHFEPEAIRFVCLVESIQTDGRSKTPETQNKQVCENVAPAGHADFKSKINLMDETIGRLIS
jgi:hypothetical protein